MFKIYVVSVLLVLAHSVLGQECLPENDRIDCYPWENVTEAACIAKGCTWCLATMEGAPSCHLPASYGYSLLSSIELPDGRGHRLELTRATNISYVGNDSQRITALFEFVSDSRLRIKITDDTDRWEVPLPIHPSPDPPTNNHAYALEFYTSPAFHFKVVRKSSGVAIFDTSLGGLTFADQFIQLGIRLPSTNAYGIGENEQHSFKQDFSKWQAFGLWTRDEFPQCEDCSKNNTNIYGAHPFYTVVEEDGNAHSVLMLNSNAQEFILSPAPAYTYRTIGGLLDIHIFMGPTPLETQQQFTEAIGRAPIPPYWGLGFNLCRWGYNNLENMKAAVNRTRAAGIPQDVQFGDLDILDNWLTLTYDKANFAGLPEYIKELKEGGIKFIVTVNPGIAHNETLIDSEYEAPALGDDMDVWVKRPDGTPRVGAVWAGNSRFIDYSRPSAKIYWEYLLRKYKEDIDWDGLWLDMNEPANWGTGDNEFGCEDNNINHPPYMPASIKNNLTDLTLCPDSVQDFGIHYNVHNLYGWDQARGTAEALRTSPTVGPKRTILLSRSTFTGAGLWATHWLGDNVSSWGALRESIIGVLAFNLFGIPHTGPDICGFWGTPNEELCTRWMQVGAFFPYSRNHKGRNWPDQDPGIWGEASRNSSRDAMIIRYTLLPYLYTLFYRHRVAGDTVARALWHEFPKDNNTWAIDRQFMWGEGFLISGVTEPGAVSVEAYFPIARWYDYYTGAELVGGGSVNLSAPFGFIPLHLRGGYILPTQEPALNTQISRLNPFGFIVSLNEGNRAMGEMYWDDGETFEAQEIGSYWSSSLTYLDGVLQQSVTHNLYPEINQKTLGSIRLLGETKTITSVLVNGVVHTDFQVTPTNEVKVANLNVPINSNFTITFQ